MGEICALCIRKDLSEIFLIFLYFVSYSNKINENIYSYLESIF
ncbi:hypothetical protein SynA15127_02044 [Synechococcus sp. A15-127]|nr:hypothetical protein SynA15127_02044 [Synechococcus sp. A15-127]